MFLYTFHNQHSAHSEQFSEEKKSTSAGKGGGGEIRVSLGLHILKMEDHNVCLKSPEAYMLNFLNASGD